MRIVRYSNDNRHEWDEFVKASKNGTFLFMRDYMEYHSDRFVDHSLLYYNEKNVIIAIMPANEHDGAFYSHQGLTFGGFVLSDKVYAVVVETLFEETRKYLQQHGFTEWIYKQMPTIYHKIPSQEDEYWLWRNGAEIAVCNLSSTIDYSCVNTPKAEYCRRNALARLSARGVRLNMDADLRDYWMVLENCLQERYGAAPVHSIGEITRLKALFPDNIICCTAESETAEILAGVVLYVTEDVVHVQYSATTTVGRQQGAQDFLYLSLINHYASDLQRRFFDMGTSNEDGGKVLNATLNRYKEGFGARGVTCKQWRIRL